MPSSEQLRATLCSTGWQRECREESTRCVACRRHTDAIEFRGFDSASGIVQIFKLPIYRYSRLLRTSDAETTKIALNELHEHDTVVLVVQATQIDEDLAD